MDAGSGLPAFWCLRLCGDALVLRWHRLRLLDVTEDGRLWLSEEEPPVPQSTSSMFTPLLQLVRLSFLTLHTHTHTHTQRGRAVA